MGFLEWFSIITGAATLISLAIGISAWHSGKIMKETQSEMHATTQQTLSQMQADSQQTLERMNQTQSQMHANTQQILDRMDQRAEERYRDLRGRIDGEV